MKSMRIIFIFSSLIALAGFGLALYLMFWGPDRIPIADKSWQQLWDDGDLVPIIVIPIVLIISGVTMLPFLRIMFPGQIKNGLIAQAKVLKVWDTGVSINDDPQVGLLLEFTPINGSSIRAEGKTIVSRLNAALVQPGITADVKYDPQKPQRLQVVTLHVEGAASNDPATRLEKLDQLRDKHLITDDEYQSKRQDILQAL